MGVERARERESFVLGEKRPWSECSVGFNWNTEKEGTVREGGRGVFESAKRHSHTYYYNFACVWDWKWVCVGVLGWERCVCKCVCVCAYFLVSKPKNYDHLLLRRPSQMCSTMWNNRKIDGNWLIETQSVKNDKIGLNNVTRELWQRRRRLWRRSFLTPGLNIDPDSNIDRF